MDEAVFPKRLGGTVVIDICHACSGLWFDTFDLGLEAVGSLLRGFLD